MVESGREEISSIDNCFRCKIQSHPSLTWKSYVSYLTGINQTIFSALTDLLGDDFVKFLDPNYESEDYKETEENGDGEEIIVTTTKISTTINKIKTKS